MTSMADLIIVRHRGETCANLAQWLRTRGCTIRKEDDDLGYIECSAPAYVIAEIKKKPCVAYVRQVMGYHSDVEIIVDPTQDAL